MQENEQKDRKANCGSVCVAVLGFLVLSVAMAGLAAGQTAITTYHYDNHRTGWNNQESSLTPSTVWQPSFGLQHTVVLDDQVDAQPLIVPGVQITAGLYPGVHDVAYVTTESNTVYAIDVHTGTVLLSPNFGAPVYMPLGCGNNGPNVGITSTPVIDLSTGTLYVMVYTQDSAGPPQVVNYRLHALDLGSLADKGAPQVVTASQTLSDGTTFTFNPMYQRQRPALLLANHTIYAGFGSFCDWGMSQNNAGANGALSRGWLLAWSAWTLAPVTPTNPLMLDQWSEPVVAGSSSEPRTLSSIWMSGSGPVADNLGNVLFVTGNSDNQYSPGINIQESVVKVSPTTSILDWFTPSNEAVLDQYDGDFGSGGVMLLPDQPGSIPHLAVAAGKDGNMYLMNEDNLGHFSSTTNHVLGTYMIGNCWCSESYYVDPSDGAGRVVSSGGFASPTTGVATGDWVGVWKVQTSPSVGLIPVSQSASLDGATGSAQDPGFFTSISSNGTASPIIWVLSRPGANTAINLFAFNPETAGGTLNQMVSLTAGAWPYSGNANLVPVVANGQVFVASSGTANGKSYGQLQIFGMTGLTVPIFHLLGLP